MILNALKTTRYRFNRLPSPSSFCPKRAFTLEPQLIQIDLRVGRILRVKKHENAHSLYIEDIDLGELVPRQIVSGLVKHLSEDELLNAPCVVFANLKPTNLRSAKSFGMVLAATNAEGKTQLVSPPVGAPLGSRVVVAGLEAVFSKLSPAPIVDPKQANNPWASIQPLLTTDANGICQFDGHQLIVPGVGVCRSGVANATIS